MTTHRSPLFELADEYVETRARMSPMTCTELGIPGYEDQLDLFTTAEADEAADYSRQVLAKAKAMTPIDDIDRIAQAVFVERLESNLKLHDSKEAFVTYSPIGNPAAYIRQVFSIMDTDGEDAIKNVTARLNQVGASLSGWQQSLEDMDALGKKTARRQVIAVADQLKTYADGGWQKMAEELDPAGKHPALHEAAKKAAADSLKLSEWMRNIHAPRSTEVDGVGEERYQQWVRYFTGAELDLRATYEWGVEDLARINDRMHKAAAKLGLAGKPLKEVADFCENAELHRIVGEDALLTKLKNFTQEAVAKLNGKYFDIDESVAFCDARLAPDGTAAAPYYIPPSEDLSRPGTTWYPTLGHKRFNFWHIASTWYHEAVPGHHLQLATAVIEKDRLSRFQRSSTWIPGYGEGWALYAERFMDELGAFDDPALELGYLSGQALRAARVVVDIGMHCGYKDSNGVVWNADSAFDLLVNNAMMAEDFAESEIERYLGWPGQAISYKVGERYWMEIREEAKSRLGAAFDIRKFHSFSLKIGPMGLDALKTEMANWNGN
jgi:uncharacterized protein (DUF885 family)